MLNRSSDYLPAFIYWLHCLSGKSWATAWPHNMGEEGSPTVLSVHMSIPQLAAVAIRVCAEEQGGSPSGNAGFYCLRPQGLLLTV